MARQYPIDKTVVYKIGIESRIVPKTKNKSKISNMISKLGGVSVVKNTVILCGICAYVRTVKIK